MKRTSTIFSLLVATFAIGGVMSASAQGRGHERKDKDHDRKHSREHYDHRDRDDRHRNDHNHDKRHHRDYDRREVRHVHHYHDRYCHHEPVVVHHHHTRPRYVYYRDYDVYYDCHKSVYISFSGKRWMVSATVPVTMRHVNLRTVKRYEVDPDSYLDNDDFPRFLETRRPTYGRECSDW